MALTAAHRDAALWFVRVEGQAYGPYGAARLAAFIEEGRITGTTPLAPSADGPWSKAGEALPDLFGAPVPQTGDDDTWAEIADDHFAVEPDNAPRDARTARNEHARGASTALFVIATPTDGITDAVTLALGGFGEVLEIAPGIWCVRTDSDASRVRTIASRELGRGQRLLVLAASDLDAAWFNLGREADAGLRAMLGQS